MALVLLLASAVLPAQRGREPTAKPVSSAAVQQAEEQIGRAAAARGILLSDSARQTLAKEAVHQEATSSRAASGPVTGTLSEAKVSELLTPLAGQSGKQLDARDVQARVADAKTRQVVATLPADIAAHEQASGRTVPEEVRARMMEDLTKQSEALSKSGLPAEAIRVRNQTTLQAIAQVSGAEPLTTQSYQAAMAEIFTRQVRLSILTMPVGANVSAAGFSIGRTNITDKPFKPGAYTFTFRLEGYQDAEREFYVTPGEDADSFTQVLTPAAAAGGTPDQQPSLPRGSASRSTFPWGYAVLISIIVVLIGVLIARRR